MYNVNLATLQELLNHTYHRVRKSTRDERVEKDRFIRGCFARERISNIDEQFLRTLIERLWSYQEPSPKRLESLLVSMLRPGLRTIQDAFYYLLYNDDPLSKRFEFTRDTIPTMGAATISEIMAHCDHKRYAIWNSHSRDGLIKLGIDKALLPKKRDMGKISGVQYTDFCALVKDVHQQIVKIYPEFSDLYELDFLFYYAGMADFYALSS